MDTAPRWNFKLSKLRFIFNIVCESLLVPMHGEQHVPIAAPRGELAVTWIGHSSFLIEMAGKRILIDPVFSSFLVILKRKRKPGVRVRDLLPIDLVLLTHAHMDHLDLPSLRAILRNNRRLRAPAPLVVVPHGVDDLVERLSFGEVRTLKTWQATAFDQLKVTKTPARHWGARYFNDVDRGYGGYVLAAGGRSLFHCGDSAYFPGFAAIEERLRPEIALLPIGAYSPDNFRSVHTSPEDALAAFHDLGSQVMIPMHYGSFRLSLEPMEEPPVRLMAAATEAGIADRVLLLREGQTQVIPVRQTSTFS